jgi:hypothetical protein
MLVTVALAVGISALAAFVALAGAAFAVFMLVAVALAVGIGALAAFVALAMAYVLMAVTLAVGVGALAAFVTFAGATFVTFFIVTGALAVRIGALAAFVTFAGAAFVAPFQIVSAVAAAQPAGGDGFDLDGAVLGQGGHLDGGTRRGILAEEFSVDGVHQAEFVHVFHENGGFEHLAHLGAALFEDGFQVSQRLASFGLDAAGNQVAGLRVDAKLAGGEDQLA